MSDKTCASPLLIRFATPLLPEPSQGIDATETCRGRATRKTSVSQETTDDE